MGFPDISGIMDLATSIYSLAIAILASLWGITIGAIVWMAWRFRKSK
jgi:hypothetical protein